MAGAIAQPHPAPPAADDSGDTQASLPRRSSAVDRIQDLAIDEAVEPILVFMPRRI
jgi:hypothetical protein